MFYYVKFEFGSFRIRIRIRTVYSDSDSDPSKRSDRIRIRIWIRIPNTAFIETTLYFSVVYGLIRIENHLLNSPISRSVLRSVLDLDPCGSALKWLLWIRICIGNTDADPDPGHDVQKGEKI